MQPVIGEVQLRSPLSVLSQNINNVGGLPCLYYRDDNSKPEVHHGMDLLIFGSSVFFPISSYFKAECFLVIEISPNLMQGQDQTMRQKAGFLGGMNQN